MSKDIESVKQIIEALVFSSDTPISEKKLRSYTEIGDGDTIRSAIDLLNTEYEQTGRAFRIHQIAGGFQFLTIPDCAPFIRRMQKGKAKSRLSRAALEAISIIAYNQPVTRTDIDMIRGVNSDGVIRNLLERRLVTIVGRAQVIGRPLLYATTDEFLSYFGLNDLADLPKMREIGELLGTDNPDWGILEGEGMLDPTVGEQLSIDAKLIEDGKDSSEQVSGRKGDRVPPQE